MAGPVKNEQMCPESKVESDKKSERADESVADPSCQSDYSCHYSDSRYRALLCVFSLLSDPPSGRSIDRLIDRLIDTINGYT